MTKDEKAAAAEITRLRAANADMHEMLTEHERLWVESGLTQLAEMERLRAEVEDERSMRAHAERNARELRAEVAALRADAERYRWLRTYGWDICSLQCAVLDAAIDAARKEK